MRHSQVRPLARDFVLDSEQVIVKPVLLLAIQAFVPNSDYCAADVWRAHDFVLREKFVLENLVLIAGLYTHMFLIRRKRKNL